MIQIKFTSFSFHLCTYSKDLRSHCSGDSGGPLTLVDWQNEARYGSIKKGKNDIYSVTQVYPDCCCKFWYQKGVRVRTEARGLH